jgi:hypothetical protein
MSTRELPDNVRRLHPSAAYEDQGTIPVRRIGKYPGGPTVDMFGASPLDRPEARERARVLMHQMWVTLECTVMGLDSDLRDGVVAVTTHPSIAEAIANAHNVSLRDGWAPL